MLDRVRAETYNRLAKKARHDAAQQFDPRLYNGLIKLAENYERMAHGSTDDLPALKDPSGST